MIEEQLFTKEGNYVATVKVAPFLMKPDVLVWGDRMFQYKDGQYLECFAVYVQEAL